MNDNKRERFYRRGAWLRFQFSRLSVATMGFCTVSENSASSSAASLTTPGASLVLTKRLPPARAFEAVRGLATRMLEARLARPTLCCAGISAHEGRKGERRE